MLLSRCADLVLWVNRKSKFILAHLSPDAIGAAWSQQASSLARQPSDNCAVHIEPSLARSSSNITGGTSCRSSGIRCSGGSGRIGFYSPRLAMVGPSICYTRICANMAQQRPRRITSVMVLVAAQCERRMGANKPIKRSRNAVIMQ